MGKRALTPSEDFSRFWAAYPKRVARLDALKAWNQLNPSSEQVEEILNAVAWQVRQPSWLKDGGQYVPYPASWIRQGRWLDEADATVAAYACPHRPTCADGRWRCERKTEMEAFRKKDST